jgi:hypothetical protein
MPGPDTVASIHKAPGWLSNSGLIFDEAAICMVMTRGKQNRCTSVLQTRSVLIKVPQSVGFLI